MQLYFFQTSLITLILQVKGFGRKNTEEWSAVAAWLQKRQSKDHLLNFNMLHFFCRPSLSCSLYHPFKNSHIIRPISASCPKLYKTSDQATPSSMAPHVKARCPEYPGSKVKRFPVPDNKVDWSQRWPQYQPVSYTAPSVLTKPVWADPDIG